MTGRAYERPERHNEYFIPGDGISREVIQADICRYLGNDALVKPGTHQGRSGYLIRAYRNLTSEMIADLKADSARWEQEVERRANMGYSRGSYVSPTHELRSQGGPSPPSYAAAPAPYVDPYAQQSQYGAPQGQPYAGTPSYSTSQSPGYNQNPYASPPQQNPYSGPGQGQPPISAPDVHQPSYTYSSNPSYGYERGNAAPRYPGAGYDNEPEYSPVTSGIGYPAATAPSDARLGMDPRYTPEAAYDHRTGASRPQQNRDPHRRPR
ncbi:hypothetical protein DPV78_001578 [Talaromyces pinophilus]|nr:hypothetical protein DPV78_001578 [Talaromyces pinophilus]